MQRGVVDLALEIKLGQQGDDARYVYVPRFLAQFVEASRSQLPKLRPFKLKLE